MASMEYISYTVKKWFLVEGGGANNKGTLHSFSLLSWIYSCVLLSGPILPKYISIASHEPGCFVFFLIPLVGFGTGPGFQLQNF